MGKYEDLVKEYRKLAKQADQRLVRLEGYKYRTGFKTATKWAYARAIKDIKKWSGEEAKRFNVKPPKTILEIEAKILDIKQFINSPTSTLRGISNVYKKKADTINKKYGTDFTWEDFAKFYLSGTAEKLNNSYGSKTTLVTIAKIQELDNETIEKIKKQKDVNLQVEDKIVEDTVKKILRDQGLDLSMLK